MEGNRPPAGAGNVEFRLRSTSSTNLIHNIMTLAGPPVNMADFTAPVRLIRDPSVVLKDDRESALKADSEEEDRNRGIARKRKKTRIILKNEDEEEQTLRGQEKAPWLLEDFDGQHSYVSQLIRNPEAKYVIFVNQGNEFRVVPVGEWYKFVPKLTYRPLTLEEAEEKMAKKGKNEDYDRWLMRKRTAAAAAATTSGESSGVASVAPEKSQQNFGPTVTKRFVDLDEEGFDYNEVVDDDDGEGLYSGNHLGDDEDPSAPRIERPRQVKSLNDAGKQVKKIFKHLDRSNYALFHDSEEEDGYDPYADEEDRKMSSEEETESQPKKVEVKPVPQLQLKPLIPALNPQRSADNLVRPKSSVPSRSRSKSPVGSTNISNRNRSKSPPRVPIAPLSKPSSSQGALDGTPASKSPVSNGSASALLTESEIISILRETPLTTKDLIARVKGKLKAEPQNKEIFRGIVRKVATVNVTSSSSQDGDKILELKPEYRS